jgi:hypothetical protein
LWSIGAKGGEIIVHKDRTQRGRKYCVGENVVHKIDSKRGENLKGRINKRRGSTKILSTQVGGASSLNMNVAFLCALHMYDA